LGFSPGVSWRVGPPEKLDKPALAGHNTFNAREIERMQARMGANRRGQAGEYGPK